MPRLIDLTGKVFGHLTVVSRAECKSTNGGALWNCVCDCKDKTECVMSGENLRRGTNISCGCTHRANLFGGNRYTQAGKYEDFTGRTFGRLTVLERIITGNTSLDIEYKCSCSCEEGKICYVKHRMFRGSRPTQSCGCLLREVNAINGKAYAKTYDLTDRVFGKVKALRCKDTTMGYHSLWECECSCGIRQTFDVAAVELLRGRKLSCGCLRSIGEFNIRKFLVDEGITFKSQYQIDGLVGVNGGKLMFDFALFKEDKLVLCVEYDGLYHFAPESNFSYNGVDVVKIVQEHDKRKNEYCAEHGIYLLRLTGRDYTKNNQDIKTVYSLFTVRQ